MVKRWMKDEWMSKGIQLPEELKIKQSIGWRKEWKSDWANKKTNDRIKDRMNERMN